MLLVVTVLVPLVFNTFQFWVIDELLRYKGDNLDIDITKATEKHALKLKKSQLSRSYMAIERESSGDDGDGNVSQFMSVAPHGTGTTLQVNKMQKKVKQKKRRKNEDEEGG